MATFGQRLRILREEKQKGQKEIGDIVGLSESTIGKYESDERTPSPDTINKLADYFNVTSDFLLGRSDIRNPEVINDPEVISLARARQKMTPEQRAKWDRINKEIFPEAFDNDDK